MKYRILYQLMTLLLGNCIMTACNKADDFGNMLKALPQVSYQNGYSYRGSYAVGDTMTITGRLQPNNGLKIRIGNEDAVIVAADSLHFRPITSDTSTIPMDWVKVLITDKMGSGANIPVTITSGGHSINAASIHIYGRFGEGSFQAPLALKKHADISNPYNVFLNCVNGKGDLYFYEAITGSLQHIKKDGTIGTLLSKAQLTGGAYNISSFVAGAVNPQGTMAWVSIKTETASYVFVEADLKAKTSKVLNRTQTYAEPYVGAIGQVNLVANAVFADSKNNVYLVTPGKLYFQSQPYGSIAKYNSTDGTFSYQFRTKYSLPGIPGVSIDENGALPVMLPDAAVMYMPGSNSLTAYDLVSRIRLSRVNIEAENYRLVPSAYTGAFSTIRINFGGGMLGNNSNPKTGFGFLPKPGNKMVFLLYQYLEGPFGPDQVNLAPMVDGPKWMVFDFAESRTYQYAPQAADLSGYAFEPFDAPGKPQSVFTDRMLNYDEEGHLYASANGNKIIVKTILK